MYSISRVNGATFSGTVTAKSFVGDGSKLTGITGGGGGGSSVALDSTVPNAAQQALASSTQTGLATYFTNDSTKAAATNVTRYIQGEVDSLNTTTNALGTTTATLTSQVAELDGVVGALTGLTLGSAAGSAFATAVSAFTSGGATNNALKKADLLDQTTISSITNTSTTTTYDARTISAIATAVNTLQGQTIPNLSTSTNFGTTGTSAETFGNANQQTTINGQVNIPYLNLQDTQRSFSVVSIIGPNIVVLPTAYSGIQVGMTVQFSGSVGAVGLISGTNYTVSAVSGINVTLASISTLTNIVTVNGVTMAFTIPNPLTTATNFGTKATSTVTVGVSGQTTSILGNIQINGASYSAPPNISTTTTYSDQASSAVSLGNANQQTNILGATYIPNVIFSDSAVTINVVSTTSPSTITLSTSIPQNTIGKPILFVGSTSSSGLVAGSYYISSVSGVVITVSTTSGGSAFTGVNTVASYSAGSLTASFTAPNPLSTINQLSDANIAIGTTRPSTGTIANNAIVIGDGGGSATVTMTGTVNINTSATTNTNIGNATGTLTLAGGLAFNKSQTVSSTSAHTASFTGFPLVAIIALSSEIGVMAASTSIPLAQWRVPFKCRILGVRASLNYNDATNNIQFNACTQTGTNQPFSSATQLLSTALLIPAGQYSSVTASGAGTLNASLGVVPDDTIIAIYCTSYTGSSLTAGGAKMSIYYSYSA